MDETIKEAKRFDHAEHEDKGFGSALNYKKVYMTVEEANTAAKRMINDVLAKPVGRERAKQEDVSNGDLPHGYQLPPSDTTAHESIGSGSRGTYTGSLTFFCDPYGSDVWNVCVTEYSVRVVVQGDRSTPPPAESKATGTAAGGKAKAGGRQPPKLATASKKSTVTKVSASRTSIAKGKAHAKGKPRVGIVSVPGMSKKEVAALNKAARASAAAMRKVGAHDSDSDDEYGYSGLKGRSEAFWERELL